MFSQILHVLSSVLLATLLLCNAVTAQSNNQAFQREVRFQKIVGSKVVAEHVRRSAFSYDDRGRLVERVLYKTPNLKGISDDDVEAFASGRKMKERAGVQMVAQYFDYRTFGSSVEVKDTWASHWPGGEVKVYFSSRLRDRDVLLDALKTWNALVPEVQFAYAGTAEVAQICEACLTVLRNPNLKDGGTFEPAHRGDGLIVYGRIYLRRLDRNTLFSIFAHDVGHSLGLPHSDRGLMREKLPKGQKISPSEAEAELVNRLLNE